jgi:hypothetical protein
VKADHIDDESNVMAATEIEHLEDTHDEAAVNLVPETAVESATLERQTNIQGESENTNAASASIAADNNMVGGCK